MRNKAYAWDPRQQRPECWNLYNTRLGPGQSLRVFPLSNWTETDIWTYALHRQIALAPLYFAARRPTIERDGALIVVDDMSRMMFRPGERVETRTVRFRTLGCWPVTAAVPSDATDLRSVVRETFAAPASERQGRIGDAVDGGSLEQKKREGYF